MHTQKPPFTTLLYETTPFCLCHSIQFKQFRFNLLFTIHNRFSTLFHVRVTLHDRFEYKTELNIHKSISLAKLKTLLESRAHTKNMQCIDSCKRAIFVIFFFRCAFMLYICLHYACFFRTLFVAFKSAFGTNKMLYIEIDLYREKYRI